MFFNISKDTENIISDFLDIKKNHNQNSGSNVEFEIRFGKFHFSKNQDGKSTNTFDSNVEIDFFHHLKASLNNKNFEKTVIKTKEYIYTNPNGKGTIKKIVSENADKYMIKNTFKKYNIFDYNLRLSLANEKYFDKSYFKNFDFNNYEIIRDKTRYTYNLNICSLDLTIVEEQDILKGTNTKKYEVEFEIYNNIDIQSIINIIGGILQTSQKNFYVITNKEKNQVIYEYKNIVSTPFFVGAQPETLHKNQLSKLYQEEYSVTDKADGDRVFMFIDKNKNVYFIDNNINEVYKTNIKSSEWYSCIVDGELVRSEKEISFYAFDLIAFNNQDVRGQVNFLLKERLDIARNIINDIDRMSGNQTNYKFYMKQFFFNNVFIASEVILNNINNKPYKNDGLIYTPINQVYPTSKKWPSLLKWKPAELNTIDFYSVKEDGVWKLYVQQTQLPKTDNDIHSHSKKNQTVPVLFDINVLCPNPQTLDVITFQTTFDDSLIDPTTGDSFQSNTVIEYSWDFEMKKFKPVRTRWDKTANPKKHGNFTSIACDIWNNIHNPIENELLFKFTTYNKEDKMYEKMRRFHNKVKEMLYSKYTKNSENLLELCSGKGGDLHKWIYNDIKNIDGYDISEKNISECVKRVEQMKHKMKSHNYKFYKLDLTSENACDIIAKQSKNKYDNICCNFGIHYFFKSQDTLDSIIKTFNKNLKPGGNIILTFMDDSKINNLFGDSNGDNIFDTKEDEVAFFMKKETKNLKLGNSLRIVLNGNNILGEGSDEYIIDFQEFANKMSSLKYKLIDTQLFENVYENYYKSDFGYVEMDSYEKKISFLNRYCVFKKIDENSEIEIEIPVQIPISNNLQINPEIIKNEFKTIDLHKYDISVFKINNLWDIIDILNCVSYQYYKNQIQNIEITSFQNIEHLFKTLNIQYIPKFLDSPDNLEGYEPISNYVYFTYYKHSLEKKNESDEIEIVDFDNWYIILHKDRLLFSNSELKTSYETKMKYIIVENVVEKTTSLKQETKENVVEESGLKMRIKSFLETKKYKIPDLKDMLKECNLKTSGNKDELVNRLNEYLKI